MYIYSSKYTIDMQNEKDFYDYCNEFEYNHDFLITNIYVLYFKKVVSLN